MEGIRSYNFTLKVRYVPSEMDDTTKVPSRVAYTKIHEGVAPTLFDVHREADSIMESVPRKITLDGVPYKYVCHTVEPKPLYSDFMSFREARQSKKIHEIDRYVSRYAPDIDAKFAFLEGMNLQKEKSRWKNITITILIYALIIIGIVSFVGL